MKKEKFYFIVGSGYYLLTGVYQALLRYVSQLSHAKNMKIGIPTEFIPAFKRSPFFNKQENKFFGVYVEENTKSEEVVISSDLPETFFITVCD